MSLGWPFSTKQWVIRQRLFILAISKKLVLQDNHLKERIPVAVLLDRHWYPTLFTFPYDEARSQRHWWLWHLYGNWDSSKVTSTCALPASSKFLCYFMVSSLRYCSFTVTLANMLWSGNLCLYRSKAQDYLRVEFMSSWTRLCYICTISECWKTFVSYHLQKSCTCSKIEREKKSAIPLLCHAKQASLKLLLGYVAPITPINEQVTKVIALWKC